MLVHGGVLLRLEIVIRIDKNTHIRRRLTRTRKHRSTLARLLAVLTHPKMRKISAWVDAQRRRSALPHTILIHWYRRRLRTPHDVVLGVAEALVLLVQPVCSREARRRLHHFGELGSLTSRLQLLLMQLQ